MDDYKIELGVKLNTSDLSEQIGKLDNKHKIKVGVDLGVEDIRKRISAYNENTNNAKLKLKIKLDTSDLKKQIGDIDLSAKGKGLAVPVDTKSLEDSLKEVKDIIASIQKSLGTLDDGNGMKSLLSSVNQIADALGKATDESETLVKSLSALSKKEFGFNFNLKTGNTNPLKAATDYGIEARRKAIPAMKEQVSYLQNILGGTEKADKALERYLVKQYRGFGGVTEKNRLQREMLGGVDLDGKTISYNKQMGAYEQTVDYLKKIVVESGKSLAGFDSQFSKSAENIVDDTVKIQTGVKQTEEALEAVSQEMKQIFGGGISAEGLSISLEPIIANLNEIKEAIQELSKVKPFDGLTASFDRLSGSIENLLANAEKVRGVLGSGLGSIDTNVDSIKTSTANKKSKTNNDKSELDAYIDYLNLSKEDAEKVKGKFISLAESSARSVDSKLYEDSLDDLIATIKQLGVVSDKADDYLKQVFNELQKYNIDVARELGRETFGDSWNTERSKHTNILANKNSASKISVDTAYQELNSVFPSLFPEDISNQYDQLRKIFEIYDKAKIYSKDRTFSISENFSDSDIREDVLSVIDNIRNQIKAEQNLAQASTQSSDTVAKNENKKQQSYRESLIAKKKELEKYISEANASIEQWQNRLSNPKPEDTPETLQRFSDGIDTWDEEIKKKQIELQQIESVLQNTDIQIGATEDNLVHLDKALDSIGFDSNSIDAITKDFEQLGIVVKNVTTRLNEDGSINLTVKGVDQYERAVTAIRRTYLDDEGEVQVENLGTTVSQSLKESDTFIKQQKRSVADLTNDINELNRKAIDPNESKPIKDSSHLKSLKTQYETITKAIEKMGRASNDNDFQKERNNVNALISEYKSLTREYKNAETVATSLRSKDIDTVKSTYASKLDVLISKMQSSGVYTSGFESGAENLRSILSGATDASGLVKFLNGLDKIEAGYKRADASVKEFNRSQKVGINVSGLESKIADIQRISPEIDKFETEINGAKVTVQSLLNDLSKIKTQGDFTVVNSRFKAFSDAAKAAGIAVAETVTKASSITKIKDKLQDTGFNGFEQEVARAHAEAKKLEGVYDDLENALRELDIAMANVSSADQANDTKRLVAANEEYENSLKRVYSQLKLYQQAEKQAFDAEMLKQKKESLNSEMEVWLKENSRAAKDFGAEIRNLQGSLDSLDDRGVKLVGQQFKTLTKQAQAMGKTGLTVFDKLKLKVKEYMAYLSAAEMFMYAEQALRSMFEQVKLIDAAMTELKKVTNETDEAYDRFLSNAADRAREIGTTIDGLVSSTADFARLGYGFEDAQGLAEVANIYAVVGDEIDGVEGATESLISTMAAFKDEFSGMNNTDTAMRIIDIYNELGNKFAITSGGLGEALERSASSLAAANNSIYESAALITAANTVVQDPEQVGKGYADIKSGYIG